MGDPTSTIAINHGSYVHTDGPDAFTAGSVAAFVNGGDMEDGEDHLVDIVWTRLVLKCVCTSTGRATCRQYQFD